MYSFKSVAEQAWHKTMSTELISSNRSSMYVYLPVKFFLSCKKPLEDLKDNLYFKRSIDAESSVKDVILQMHERYVADNEVKLGLIVAMRDQIKELEIRLLR